MYHVLEYTIIDFPSLVVRVAVVTYADLKYSIPDFSAYFVAILHGAGRIHPIKSQILHAGLLWVNIADEEY